MNLNTRNTDWKDETVQALKEDCQTRIATLEAAVKERDDLHVLLQEIYDEGHGGALRGAINEMLVKTAAKVQS